MCRNKHNLRNTTTQSIEDQSRVEIIIDEQNTIWHHILPESYANKLLEIAQNKYGLGIGVLFVILYMIGLYIFDGGLFGMFSVYYSVIVLIPTLPGSILFFGTLNVPICLAILKSTTFIFKMYSVILANTMSVVWAYHNLSFDVISKTNWFIIYGFYFFINILTTAMGCLLDGFKWSKYLKIIGPLLLAIYFTQTTIYWHYLDCDTMLHFAPFGYRKDFVLTSVAQNAGFNAALFFYAQTFNAFWYGDRATMLSTTALLKWERKYRRTYTPVALKGQSSVLLSD
eukprot:210212_1